MSESTPSHHYAGSNPDAQETTHNELLTKATSNLMRILGKKGLNSIHLNEAIPCSRKPLLI